MIRTGLLSLVALLALTAGADAMAQAPRHEIPPPLLDPVSRCAVHIPPSIAIPFPHLDWVGECRDGLAEGHGTASFTARDRAKPDRILEGWFRNGVFVGNAPVKNDLLRIDNYDVLIDLPHDAPLDGRLWLRARFPGDGSPVRMCPDGVGEMLLETPPHPALQEEKRLRAMFERMIQAFRTACPSLASLRLAIVAGKMEMEDHVARAALDAGAAPEALHSFQTLAAAGERGPRTRMQDEIQRDKAAASRRNCQDFTRSHNVATWVKARQLQSDPSVFEGRIVAFAASFDRSLGADLTLMRDDLGGEVVVRGLPDYLQRENLSVAIAGRSLGRKKLPAKFIEFGVVTVTGWALCQRSRCDDYIGWTRTVGFRWGEDQSEFLK